MEPALNGVSPLSHSSLIPVKNAKFAVNFSNHCLRSSHGTRSFIQEGTEGGNWYVAPYSFLRRLNCSEACTGSRYPSLAPVTCPTLWL